MEQFWKEVVNIAEGTPLIGHSIAIGHYIAGKNLMGDQIMNLATRTTFVLGAGVNCGMQTSNPIVGVIAGIGMGAAYDIGNSIISQKLQGQFAFINNIIQAQGTLDDIIGATLTPIMDALIAKGG